MKKHLLATVLLLAFTGLAQAQQAPLIDRELFFDNPEITGGQISPDGQWMTFIKEHKGVLNIWLKKLDAPFEDAQPITADTTRPIPGYFWTFDSKYVLYVQDKGGNEDYHVYALDPFAEAGPDGVPPARDLTPYEKTRALIFQVSEDDPNKMWVGMNDRDAAWHDLYAVDIASGERTLLYQNDDRITSWTFDWDEQPRFASRTREDGFTEILRMDGDEFTKVYETGPLEEAGIVAFTKDNKLAYMSTNKGRNFTELVTFDPATQKETLVDKDPMGKVDLGSASFNRLTRELEYITYVDAKRRVYFRNQAREKEYNYLLEQFPDMEVRLGSQDKKQRVQLVTVFSDTDPGATYLFDRKSKELTFQYRPRPKLKPEHLSPVKPIAYPSSDGMEIPAYLTLPKGIAAKGLPLIVLPHGGPWARDYWGYDSYAQFLANRGYAVLQMNFRGSTGYGKAFLDAGNREWGELMQDDITWGVKHLVAEGIADPERIGIMGGSYGGYATLAGVTFTPDLYKAAVAIVAPSNLNTLLASIPPYWEAGRKFFYLRMGDPSTPEGKAKLEQQSPLNHIDKIRTPLMVVQGANDPRVKKAEADQIIVAMRDNGIPVSYICAPDEGHGFARPVNNMAFLAAAEEFLAEHLGGRYQESMTPEVAKRLAEITVDIATVEKPRRADELAEMAASAKVLKAVREPVAGEYEYAAELSMGAQQMKMSVKRSVSKEDGKWVITDETETPMGNIRDVNVLAAKSLDWQSREVQQGPVNIQLRMDEASIKAEIAMPNNPEKQTFEKPAKEAPAPDGAGLDLWLAAMDLAVGDTFFYTIFDAQAQVLKTIEAKVVRQETVSVPAGEFDALVVETKNAEDGTNPSTYWLANGMAVKQSAVMTQMGGATMTVELVK
jgi:dipeptidyl aminopeptidase/acylaminoacyl peptidase